jgi:hypothetical protein
MNNKRILQSFMTIALLLCILANISAQEIGQPESSFSGEDVILQWNRVLTETIRTPGAHPSATIFPVRSYAMMHAAMYDAVNSIEGSHTPYLTDANPGNSPFFAGIYRNRRISQEAAAAIAAHGVLVGLYPSRQAIYDAELADSLDGIPNIEKQLAVPIGQLVAQRMLQARANDGWKVTPPAYILPPTPGNWQPTPPNFAAATFTHYPGVTPFALTSNAQFDVAPPPALTTERYTADFNEVKEIGKDTSATRTAEQTQIARLWGPVGTPTNFLFVWNNVARSAALARESTLAEKARLFALLHIAHHDALQTTFTSKFKYGLWRPVTAIRRADEDGNAATEQDVNWSSLIPNPPYPAYPGNMAAIGTSQSTILALFFGRDDIAFQNIWENGANGMGGAVRSYRSFTEMANEEANSRILGGIHFRFDNEAGQSVGRNVANYVFLNFMRPRN